ncbi:MAG: FG-GAP-like repeat-containing protein [Saprospiraceae bacterium]|nr:FG-GAP-like repeat-containing protein [Saprospiraceae bacterium]
MNRLLFTFCLYVYFLISATAQVNSVQYNLVYNEATNTYGCSMIVLNGFAESSENRKLTDAKFSIKVETGTQISVVQSNAPFLNNEFFGGFSPVEWSAEDVVLSPQSDPDYDYYSFTPDPFEDSWFFNLYADNEVLLFTLAIEGSCASGVQIFENGVDPGPFSAGMNGVDFSNSMSIGTAGDQFSGLNEDIAHNRQITLENYFACEGECVTFSPNALCGLEYFSWVWYDGSTEASITICPEGDVPVSLQATDDFGVMHTAEAIVSVVPPLEEIWFTSDSICFNQPEGFFYAYSENSANEIWESLNPDIATIEQDGEIRPVSPRAVTFRLTDSITGCSIVSEELYVRNELNITSLDGFSMKVGQSLQFQSNAAGNNDVLWIPSSTDLVAMNEGKMYGLKPGEVDLFYVAINNYECLSDTVTVTIEENESCNDEGDVVWRTAQIGTFDPTLEISAFASSNSFYSNDENYSLIGYDQNTGDIWLRKIDDQGALMDEFVIENHAQHDEGANYKFELHDLDQDGLMDIVLLGNGSASGNTITSFRNLGSGEFTLGYHVISCFENISQRIEVQDFDGNGQLDIFSSCRDNYYQVIYNDNWAEIVTESSEGSRYNFVSMDYDGDGDIDIIYSDIGVLLNKGFIGFDYDGSKNANLRLFDSYNYYEEFDLIVGNRHFVNILDLNALQFEECTDLQFNDFGSPNRNFISKINGEDELVIIGKSGFAVFPLDFNCLSIEDGMENYNYSVVADEFTQIDIGGDGYTDFFHVEDNVIYASVNPNSDTSIKGFCYIDENENGMFDPNETPLKNVIIDVDQTNIQVFTDENGKYTLIPPKEPYVLTANISIGQWEQNTLVLNSEDVGSSCLDNNNFGFILSENGSTFGQISIANSITRCDFETKFYITVENLGTEDSEFDLVFDFDDETTFFQSDIPDYILNGNTFEANLGMVSPFEPVTYTITLKMPSGSASLPLLSFSGRLFSENLMLDEYAYEQQLRCSYDPNDKQVVPDRAGDENLTLFDETMTYTIRFQNNGNDTAFTVEIIDALHPFVDQSSIRVLDASHEVQTRIESDNLIFFFPDINLVDSTTNYELSQGYVAYECKAIEGLEENSTIENTADIIFDTNDPIVTNTTVNTMVSVICAPIMVELTETICDKEDFLGFNETGVYTIELLTNEGCDSIIILDLNVEPILTESIDITVCDNEEVEVLGEPMTFDSSIQFVDTIFMPDGICPYTLVDVNVVVNKTKSTTTDSTICEGEMAFGFTESGSYILDLLTSEGCDSTVTLLLDVESIQSDSIFIIACEDEELVVLDEVMTFSSSTQYVDTVWTSGGICAYDLIEIDVEVIERESVTIDTTICEGQSFLGFTQTGVYQVDSISPTTGCKVDVELDLIVLPISDPNCVVSTDEINEEGITLYPNPAIAYFSFESERQIEKIEIFDINHRLVMAQSIGARKGSVQCPDLNKGVYMVRFDTGNKNPRYKKLVVN